MQVSERQEKILFMIADDETLTSQKIAQKTGVSQRTILKDLTALQTLGILAREGGRKDGTALPAQSRGTAIAIGYAD